MFRDCRHMRYIAAAMYHSEEKKRPTRRTYNVGVATTRHDTTRPDRPPQEEEEEEGGRMLEFGVAGIPGEGDGVADVVDAGAEHEEALEAEAEAGVGDGAVEAEVGVPLDALGVEADVLAAGLEDVEVVLALGAADDFADFGDEEVHGRDGLVVVVELHVEGLDVFWIINQDDGAFVDDVRQVLLVLGVQVHAPLDVVVLEGDCFGRDGFLQHVDGLRVV
mmetsp:Transcript_18809/g.57856  ORF Transcript_18809/g.57856 Transcript_18809/m.57856 type:complete len:220 (-) Transcript_18809:1146-1805(-)